jgi:hypothetical protein
LRSAAFLSGLITAGAFACVLSGGAAATTEGSQPSSRSFTQTTGADVAVGAPDAAFHTFLDRLMGAESAGRSHAKNPRSSALGPFQFINSTFLAVMRQHFPEDVARKSEGQILALRTRHDVARRAAHAFSKDNMAYLVDRGIKPTFGHLRLAFLLGPQGAARVLQAPPSRPVTQILEGSVISANPFMRRMTAADLVARATRDVSPKRPHSTPTIVAEAAPAAPGAPAAATAAAQPDEEQPTQVADLADAEPAVQPDQPAAAAESAPVAVAQAEAQTEAQAKPEGEADAKPETKAQPAARATIAAVHLGTVRRGDRISVINVKCDSRLASCQRWIDQQVAKLIKVGSRDES